LITPKQELYINLAAVLVLILFALFVVPVIGGGHP
jgi:hypothetical protein